MVESALCCTYLHCNNTIPIGRKYCSLGCSKKQRALKPIRTKIVKCKYTLCSNLIAVTSKNRGQQFCTKNCAANHNNAIRKKPHVCKKCSVAITHKGKYCDLCRYSDKLQYGEDYSKTTLGDIKTRYSLLNYHAKIRGNSRSIYFRKSGKDLKCLLCGYVKHVDVCHITPISAFDDFAFIADINALSNLIALCKNHHWEFDNNQLSTEDYTTLQTYINNCRLEK